MDGWKKKPESQSNSQRSESIPQRASGRIDMVAVRCSLVAVRCSLAAVRCSLAAALQDTLRITGFFPQWLILYGTDLGKDSDPSADGLGGVLVVAGDHDDADTGLAAGLNGGLNLSPGGVQHA